jgi:hypothetical protein
MKGYDKDIVYFCVIAGILALTYAWVTQSKKAEMLSKNTKIDYGFFEYHHPMGRAKKRYRFIKVLFKRSDVL